MKMPSPLPGDGMLKHPAKAYLFILCVQSLTQNIYQRI